MKTSKFYKLIGLIIFLCCQIQLIGQNSLRMGLGIGYSEATNFSLAYRSSQLEILGSIGRATYRPSNFLSVGFQFYPFTSREQSELSKWFIKSVYTHDKRKFENNNFLTFEYINFRIGREFRINSNLFFQLDAGYTERISIEYNFRIRDIQPRDNFGGSVSLFYRFKFKESRTHESS